MDEAVLGAVFCFLHEPNRMAGRRTTKSKMLGRSSFKFLFETVLKVVEVLTIFDFNCQLAADTGKFIRP